MHEVVIFSPRTHSPSHRPVRLLSNGEDVRVHLPHLSAAVCTNYLTAIYGQLLVWVDGNQYNATVCVDGVQLQEPDLKVVQYCGMGTRHTPHTEETLVTQVLGWQVYLFSSSLLPLHPSTLSLLPSPGSLAQELTGFLVGSLVTS